VTVVVRPPGEGAPADAFAEVLAADVEQRIRAVLIMAAITMADLGVPIRPRAAGLAAR
jgi:hypothetical protein